MESTGKEKKTIQHVIENEVRARRTGARRSPHRARTHAHTYTANGIVQSGNNTRGWVPPATRKGGVALNEGQRDGIGCALHRNKARKLKEKSSPHFFVRFNRAHTGFARLAVCRRVKQRRTRSRTGERERTGKNGGRGKQKKDLRVEGWGLLILGWRRERLAVRRRSQRLRVDVRAGATETQRCTAVPRVRTHAHTA